MANEKNLTSGKPFSVLWRFTLPVIGGNLFQLFYTLADSVIVGKTLGANALAAVGSTTIIIYMVLCFIQGFTGGFGIRLGQMCGAGREKGMKRSATASWILSLAFTLILTGACCLLAHPILRWMQTPQEIYQDAYDYMLVILLGTGATIFYNIISNMLRALGDSRVPLYFLIISALLNVVGDLFFVVVLKWGVPGSALATMLSEALCCLCCAVYIKKKVPLLCLGKKWRVFDSSILWRTFTYGITSALQQMCVQLGKICVQTIVNVQGVSFIAAFTAINRVDDFAMTPQQNIAHASTTFMAQNRGAGKIARMEKGFLCSILLELIYTAVVSVLVFVFARPIMGLFVGTDSEEVVNLGVSYLSLISIMYVMPAATNIIQGFFRGLGDLKVTLISTILNMSARFLGAWVMIHILHGGFDRLAWANFVGWIAMLAFQIPMFLFRWRKEKQYL